MTESLQPPSLSPEEMNAITALGLRKNKVTLHAVGLALAITEKQLPNYSARPLDPVGPYIGAST